MSNPIITHGPRVSPERQRRLIEHFESSGLGHREFCRREGLNEKTFYNWRRKHQGGDSGGLIGGDGGDESQQSPGEWLALPIGDPGEREGGWDVELELGDGITLRLSKR